MVYGRIVAGERIYIHYRGTVTELVFIHPQHAHYARISQGKLVEVRGRFVPTRPGFVMAIEVRYIRVLAP